MEDKNRSKLGLAIFGAALAGLAVVGAAKLFPKMMKRCQELCEQEGWEPPAFCKKIMEKCCGESSEECCCEEPEEKSKKKKKKRAKK